MARMRSRRWGVLVSQKKEGEWYGVKVGSCRGRRLARHMADRMPVQIVDAGRTKWGGPDLATVPFNAKTSE